MALTAKGDISAQNDVLLLGVRTRLPMALTAKGGKDAIKDCFKKSEQASADGFKALP